MNPSITCPKCKAPLPANTVRGLCPKCLAMVALESGSEDKTLVVAPPPSGSAPEAALSSTLHYFGDYELLDEIARGGMGVVYKARQKSLNRIVAVKMILGGQLATDDDVKRFRTEAEAAANLQHPNIVAIHEIGEHEGRHYFSMDFVEGKDLAHTIGGEPMAAPKAAALLKTIAEAVHFAHQRGTLHRDLKPHNVLIDPAGQPRITDFGLARRVEQASDLTREGSVMGSPSYMPPEQATGRQAEIGPASDVYSLGAILYQMLTGKAPFAGATAIDTLRQVIEQEPVAPSKLNDKVSSDLETICLKCLEKKPAQRYATAQELADELQRFLNYEPIHAKPAGGTRRLWSWTQKNPWMFVGAFASLVLLLGSVAFGMFERMRYLAEDAKPSPNDATSPSILILKILPVAVLLLYFGLRSFRRKYGEANTAKATVQPVRLIIHAALGLLAIVAALLGLVLQIKGWAWKSTSLGMLPVEIIACLAVSALAWLGFHMIWQAVGVHDSSRFRNLVEKSVEKDLQYESRRWSARKLVGFSLWTSGAILWLCLMVLFAAAALRLIPGDSSQDYGIAAMGAFTGTAVAVYAAWAVHRRRRLFTNVFAPMAVTLFAAYLGFVCVHPMTASACLFLLAIGLTLGLSGIAFLPRKIDPSTGAPPRFPGRPWLDALGGTATLIALFAMLHVVENVRGRNEWKRVQSELAAKGEPLDYAQFYQPPGPDAENVMTHPVMRKYFISGQPGARRSVPFVHPPWEAGSNAPYSLSILKKLPRDKDIPKLPSEVIGAHVSQEAIPLLEFTNQSLEAVIIDLARRAQIPVAGIPKRPPFHTINWYHQQHGSGRTRKTVPFILPPCSFTNQTATKILEQLRSLAKIS